MSSLLHTQWVEYIDYYLFGRFHAQWSHNLSDWVYGVLIGDLDDGSDVW